MNFKYTKLFVLVFLLSQAILLLPNAFAESDALYLIVGSPNPKGAISFPVTLYALDKVGNLGQVREILSSENDNEFVRPYYDERVMVVEGFDKEKDYRASEFALVNMDNPIAKKTLLVKYPLSYFDVGAYLLNVPNKGLYQSVRVIDKDKLLLGVSLKTMSQEKLSINYMKFILLSGIAGGGIPGGDYISAYADSENNLTIFSSLGIINTGFQMPKSINFNKNDRLVIFINNKEILALASIMTRVRSSNGLGHTTFHVLNKKTQKWDSVQIQGGSTGVRGFGVWMAGYVADQGRKVPIPGKAKRRKDMAKTGLTADFRFERLEQYAPGILFLYNADTQKKYEINTGQGDSEVLLVEGGYVYYRVNDEIYKAPIEKNKIGDGQLLVKDDVVPDIHWAFFGPRVEIPAEEIQQKN